MLYPRLITAGADCSRIEILTMVNDVDPKDGKQTRRMFSPITDLEKLRRKVLSIGNVALILIDPISAYLGLGKVDSYRTSDVRAILGPLKELAEELEVAIIGIMHFNKKVDVTNVLLRVTDSLAFVAAPRHVFGVIDDPENGRKLFVLPRIISPPPTPCAGPLLVDGCCTRSAMIRSCRRRSRLLRSNR
jgi:hypothetical protein